MNRQARDTVDESAVTRLRQWSDAPSSGFFVAAGRSDAAAPTKQPVFDLAQTFDFDVFDATQATLILIELPGVLPQNTSIALENGLLHVQVQVDVTPEASRTWPPGAYEAHFEVPANAEAEAVAAVFDNGLLKIRIAKHATGNGRIEIAAVDEEVVWID
ncbi:MAG: Hsp20/alpha crystallin family protein [Polyangiaceae bacterium]